ncbi:uncharacterized protein [Atheta coriaria]|uniref:uncharacterized protein n=1 Tax=Dalotia coriaria TaxID=877792 RepID=UPI0031F37552
MEGTTSADPHGHPETCQEVKEKKPEDPVQPPSPNALKVAATDALNSWIHYLQMLNSLCAAGLRLSQSLNTLSQAQNTALATQNMFSWDELAKSTVVASHTVKTHIAAAMQDLCIGETFTESDALRQQEHNQQIITENLLTFINLQYQFSIAGCECLGAMAMCPCCQTMAGGLHDPDCSMANLQQCFARLYTHDSRSQMSSPHMDSPKMGEVPKSEYSRHSPMSTSASMDRPPERGNSPFHEPRGPSPIYSLPAGIESIRGPLPNPGQLLTMKGPFPGRGLRSPLHFPLFPLTGQRRWSEAAAGEVSAEGGDGTMRRWSMPWDCGRVETPWQQRYLPSKLAVPPGTSQERSRSTTPECIPPPGTVSGEGLSEAIQLLSCRPTRCVLPQNAPYGGMWAEGHDDRPHKRHPGPLQRGAWQSVDVPHSSGMSVTEHYDIFPPGMPLTSLTSRKSSSSTDSSSCLSIHSRSTTSSSEKGSESISSAGDAIRLHTNLYSMWSGNEHLPFIRLPESQEPQDDSDAEDTPTEARSAFPRPT